MAKPRTPNQKKAYAALKGRLNQYSYMIQTIYDTLNAEAARLALSTGYAGEREFRWNDYPQTKKRIDVIQDRFCRDITATIYAGTEKEWIESNIVQDMLVAKAMKTYHVESKSKRYQKLYNQTNQDALKAFQERVDGGMNLSSNVWKQSTAYRRELECAISAGVEKGMSAVTLSKRLSQYLTDFDKLKADYKEKYGKAVDCLNCEYRSMRLARTEINMAYRTAEQKRWQQFDFVIGYEIKLSGSHPVEDICDSLQGRYPKEFRFSGWHPNCMCYCVPILKTEEQFWAGDNEPIENEVTDYPDSMKSWLSDNADRVVEAQKRGTLPYWLKDNESLVDMSKSASTKDGYSDERIAKAIFPKSKEEADRLYREEAQKVWGSLNEEQKRVLYDYTGNYAKYNDTLRGTHYMVSPRRIEKTYSDIHTLEGVIDRCHFNQDVILRRGLQSEQGFLNFAQISGEELLQMKAKKDVSSLVGKTLSDKAFLSCGSAEGTGFICDFNLKIFCPKGTKMIYIEPFSRFGNGFGGNAIGDECETLLQAGTKLRVRKAVIQENGKLDLLLEVVEQKKL